MHIVKTYVAFDGMKFDNRFMCARHDFAVRPDLLDKLMAKLKGRHISEQGNWCGGDPETRYTSGACACMGCANHAFHELGLQYEHWKIWFDELRPEQPTDNIPSLHDDVDVVLQDIGPNRIDVFKAVRHITGLGIVETKNLMERPNARLKSDVDFYEGNRALEELIELGATVKLEIAKNQRWTRIA